MRSRLATSAITVALVAVALTGCAEAKDAVNDAAGGIATSAASKAAGVAQQAALTQLCQVTKDGSVADGQISESDAAALKVAVSAAEAAGVSASVTGPARQIAEGGTTPPQDAVASLKTQCANAK
jgi:hypothetical protein